MLHNIQPLKHNAQRKCCRKRSKGNQAVMQNSSDFHSNTPYYTRLLYHVSEQETTKV